MLFLIFPKRFEYDNFIISQWNSIINIIHFKNLNIYLLIFELNDRNNDMKNEATKCISCFVKIIEDSDIGFFN